MKLVRKKVHQRFLLTGLYANRKLLNRASAIIIRNCKMQMNLAE